VLDHPLIHHQRVRELSARTSDPEAEIWVQMDGESPGKLPITVRVLPGAVRIRAPYPGDLRGSHLAGRL
jgi:diacylglycerol kinase family enzyme